MEISEVSPCFRVSSQLDQKARPAYLYVMKISNDILTVPAALQADVEAAASEEHRPAIDVLRDVIERGLQERRHNRSRIVSPEQARTAQEAITRLLERRKRNVLPEDVTIHDLLDYGRA